MQDLRKFWSSEKGALLVEAALVTPFLIILFISIAQFSFALYVQATLQTAVRSAVRDASMKNATVTPTGTFSCPRPVTAPPNVPKIEEIACEYLAQSDLFGANARVVTTTYVNDNGTTSGTNPEDDDFPMSRIEVSIPLEDVVFLDFGGFLSDSTRRLSAYASMEEEP